MTAISQFEVLSAKGARSAWDGIQINEQKRTHTKSGYILGLADKQLMPLKVQNVLDKFIAGKNFFCRTVKSENGTLYLNGMPIIHNGANHWTFSTELNGAHICDIIGYVTGMRTYKSTQSGKILVDNIPCNGMSIRKIVESKEDLIFTLESEFKTKRGIVKLLRTRTTENMRTVSWHVIIFMDKKKTVTKWETEDGAKAVYGNACLQIM